MAEPIGALRAEMSAGYAQFAEDMRKAREAVQSNSRGMSRAMAGVEKSFNNSLKSIFNFKALLGKLAAAASIVGLVLLFKRSVDAADQMHRLAQAVGVPVEELSALSHAANLSGVDVESLGKSLGSFNKNIVAAASGSGDARDAFAAMGIGVRNQNGTLKTSTELLLEVAEKFRRYEDGAAKSTLATKLFGKSGADLIPLLNKGAAGIREMTDEAQTLGIVLTEDAGQSAERFKNNLTRLDAAKNGVVARIRDEMLPALENLTGRMVDSSKGTDRLDKIARSASVGMKILVSAGILAAGTFNAVAAVLTDIGFLLYTAVATPLKYVGKLLTGMSEAMYHYFLFDFSGAQRILIETFSEMGNIVEKGFEDFMIHAQLGGKDISQTLSNIWGDLKATWSEELGALPPPADLPEKIAAPIIQGAVQAKDALKALEKQFRIHGAALEAQYRREEELLKASFDARLISEREYTARLEALQAARIEAQIRRYRQFLADQQTLLAKGGTPKETLEISTNIEETRTKIEELTAELAHLLQMQGLAETGRAVAQKDRLDAYDQETQAIRTMGETELKYASASSEEQERRRVLAEQAIEMEALRLELLRQRGELGADELAELEKLAESHRVILRLMEQQSRMKSDWAAGLSKGVADYYEQVSDNFRTAQEFAQKTFQGMEDALVDFVTTGKLNFEDFANSVIADLARIAIQKTITGPLASAFGSLFTASAQGNVFNHGRLIPFARGTVVDRPTVFPMARGAGLMAEAGPEAIMPLVRTISGDLGVKAVRSGPEPGGLTINVPVNVAERSPRMQSELRREIEHTVERVVQRYS